MPAGETRDVLESAVWSLISHLPPLVVPLFCSLLLSLSHTYFLSRSLSGCKSQLIIAGKANYRRHQLARPHGVSLKQGDSQQAVRERGERSEGEQERKGDKVDSDLCLKYEVPGNGGLSVVHLCVAGRSFSLCSVYPSDALLRQGILAEADSRQQHKRGLLDLSLSGVTKLTLSQLNFPVQLMP